MLHMNRCSIPILFWFYTNDVTAENPGWHEKFTCVIVSTFTLEVSRSVCERKCAKSKEPSDTGLAMNDICLLPTVVAQSLFLEHVKITGFDYSKF